MEKVFEQKAIERTAECTIKGFDLNTEDRVKLMSHVGAADEEKLLFLYRVKDSFEKTRLVLGDNAEVLVGLTNKRIFKTEKNSISTVILDDVVSVDHIKNNFLHWDKIECRLQDGRTETFGVFHKNSCAFLVEKICEMVHNTGEREYMLMSLINDCKEKKDNMHKLITESESTIVHLGKIIQEHQEKLSVEVLYRDRLIAAYDGYVEELEKLNEEISNTATISP